MTTSLAEAHAVAVAVVKYPQHYRCPDTDCDVRWYSTDKACWVCGRTGIPGSWVAVKGTMQSAANGVLVL